LLIHNIPNILNNPDMAELLATCKKYVDKHGINALGHKAYQDTMKAIFGKDVLSVIKHLSDPPAIPPVEPPGIDDDT
jgi:hypothetical protein